MNHLELSDRRPRRRGAVLVGLLMVMCTGACVPKKLLMATVHYSETSKEATEELHAAPAILNQVCHASLELQYATERLIPSGHALTLGEFAKKPFTTAGGHTQITWEQRCKALKIADTAFLRGLSALEEYADALGALAGSDFIAEEHIKDLAKSVADDAEKLSPEAQAYKPAIQGLATPLTAVASALEQEWKARNLSRLVNTTDVPLHEVIARLQEFISTVRGGHLKDARIALADLVHTLDQVRTPTDYALAVSTSRFDIEVQNRLDRLDEKLRHMSEALESIAVAHRTLAEGWQRGESHGLATLKAMGTFARDVYVEVNAFRHPEKGTDQ